MYLFDSKAKLCFPLYVFWHILMSSIQLAVGKNSGAPVESPTPERQRRAAEREARRYF